MIQITVLKLMTEPTVDDVLDVLFKQRRNVFLTGGGGVGKTFLVNRLIDQLVELNRQRQEPLRFYVTSTTGCSAINMQFGQTLHRFMGLGLMKENATTLSRYAEKNWQTRTRLKGAGFLVIDEVSMLSDELMEKIDEVLRTVRRSSQPFGGLRVMLVGDFHQLPPVEGRYCFQSQMWNRLELKWIELTEPKRFDDDTFFAILKRARIGTLTPEDVELLQSRVTAYEQYLSSPPDDGAFRIEPTILYSTRADVSEYNLRKLAEIKTLGKRHVFRAEDKAYDLSHDFNESTIGDAEVAETPSTITQSEMVLMDDMTPREVYMRVGAQVMLTRNLDVDAGLVNGSRGVVRSISPNGDVFVDFVDNPQILIAKTEFSRYIGKRRYSRKQLPLILAWAVTIHKSQSATIDCIVADLSNLFAHGQGYVALSRVRNLKSLYLTGFVPESITADPEVVKFYKKTRKQLTMESSS